MLDTVAPLIQNHADSVQSSVVSVAQWFGTWNAASLRQLNNTLTTRARTMHCMRWLAVATRRSDVAASLKLLPLIPNFDPFTHYLKLDLKPRIWLVAAVALLSLPIASLCERERHKPHHHNGRRWASTVAGIWFCGVCPIVLSAELFPCYTWALTHTAVSYLVPIIDGIEQRPFETCVGVLAAASLGVLAIMESKYR